jgi:hypothetical protein
MHLKDDILRAFLDDELKPAVKKTTSDHLAACPKCSARLSELEHTARQVSTHIQSLTPLAGELHPSAHTALNLIDRRKEKPMSKLFRRPAWVIAGLVLVLGISLIFPPVRALAGSFLGLFRVQQVQVVSFDPAALERFNNGDTSDMLQAFFDKNMTVTHEGEFSQVDTQEAAAEKAGFTPRLPSVAKINSLGVEPGETITINIDSAMMNAGLQSFGYNDVEIPADLDGQKIVATLPTSVTAAFGDCPSAETSGEENAANRAGCYLLVQLPAPTVSAPDRFPVAQLGEVILQVLGMTPEQAAQFSQSVDWSSTLILPVPTGENLETQDIQVDGVNGTLIRETNNQYVLVWVKDGILYGLTGMNDTAPAFSLVETLQ